MSFGTFSGATGGPAWYQVWSPISSGHVQGHSWAGWLWADGAAALRVANTSDSVIRTASGQLVGPTRPPYRCPRV